jgi:hypothetical protein
MINDVASETQLESCQLVIVATASERQVQETLRRTSPGTTIILLKTELNGTKIRPDDIAEKVLITAQREGEEHFNDALQSLTDGNYEQILDGQYSIDQFIADPLSAHAQSGISLLNLEDESDSPHEVA